MNKSTGRLAILVMASAGQLIGADFSFYSTLRAGQQGPSDWEMGVGTSFLADDVTKSFGYETAGPLSSAAQQYWRAGGLTQNFRIGWNAVTNSAYVTVWNAANVATTATMSNPGPALSANAIWTLPGSTMLIWAIGDSKASSIQLSGLTLSPNTALVSGVLPGSLSASQTGTSVLNTVSAPIVINPAANGGNWYLNGTVRFTGLASQGGNAQQYDLQFLLQASGTSSTTPEPGSLGMIGGGLIALALGNPWKRIGRRK